MNDSDPVLIAVTQSLLRSGLRVATVETSAGGRISAALTALPGSSAWFDCALVAYSYPSQLALLEMRPEELEKQGAVSAWAVRTMCEMMLVRCAADLVIAESFVVGPAGGTPEKPVGHGWVAWQLRDTPPRVQECQFAGDRDAVFERIVAQALDGVAVLLSGA